MKSVLRSRIVCLSFNVALGAVGSKGGHRKSLRHEEFAEVRNVEPRSGHTASHILCLLVLNRHLARSCSC